MSIWRVCPHGCDGHIRLQHPDDATGSNARPSDVEDLSRAIEFQLKHRVRVESDLSFSWQARGAKLDAMLRELLRD